MRVEITTNFISVDECAFLNSWVLQGIEKKWLDSGVSQGIKTEKRLTSRLYGHRFEYPTEALKLSQRVRKFVGVDSHLIIDGHGKNGIVVSYTKLGGDVYKHKDPEYLGLSALRCNIITQEADEGAELFVDGNKIDVKRGDLHCYLASEYEHYVTEVKGNTPRILWMFGAYVPKDGWENGTIKYGIS